MDATRLSAFAASVPERLLRSVAALTGGAARELGKTALPARVRRSKLYDSMVESTLRFLIEQVGQVEGAYSASDAALPADFLVRRAAGNVFEIAGIAAFHASPVWVLAALADLAGAGRDLIAEIAGALQEEGLLEPGRRFETIDALLDGLDRSAARLAETANTPPLDVAALRAEWTTIRAEAARFPKVALPDPDRVRSQWNELKLEAERQGRSPFEMATLTALAAIRRLPDDALWLSRGIRAAGRRTGQVVARGLLDHYQGALAEIRETGFLRYCLREYQPYLKGAARQFSLQSISSTERFLARRRNASGPDSR